jgi:uncharacterized protein YndB with AHSA1/START domain
MTTSAIPPVTHTITVSAPAQRAFDVFTGSMTSWWPLSHHIGEADVAEILIEPRVGGRLYERGVDGTECDWGRVLAFDPPQRVVLAWHLDGEWRFDPDPARASELEVTFTAEAPDRTRVDLWHRLFERHGSGGEEVAKQVGADSGWAGIMAQYAEVAAA